jgi:hypothetical protein
MEDLPVARDGAVDRQLQTSTAVGVRAGGAEVLFSKWTCDSAGTGEGGGTLLWVSVR